MKREQVTLANWRTSPFNRWAFHHVREIVPSADIPCEPTAADFPTDPMDLSGLRVDTGRGTAQSLVQFLDETGTDGFVIVKQGRIAFEAYASGMTAESPHILMSVSKSLLGLLAGIVAARGELELDRPVTTYVPEVAGTAYRGATIR